MHEDFSKSKKLNKEQLIAVKHARGPILIIAGAGTGKTTVITERIKHLLFSKKAEPPEILALTFTEKAAKEMEERVDAILPFGYTQMWISTFHSFCDRVLRAEVLQIGLDPTFKLMTQASTIQFVRDNLFEFDLKYFRPLGNPTKFVFGMLQHFSRLQDEDISPEQYVEWVKKQKLKITKKGERVDKENKLEIAKWKELAGAYKTYNKLKVKNGKMDYGDLIANTLTLFKDRINVLKNYQKKFKYILVDEFQDTNIAQNELVKLLSGKNGNITVVADDDQSVYKWRGAAISNVVQFRKSFPKTKIVTLTKNYRSGQLILDKAYTLIQNNNPDRLEIVEGIDKKLVSQKKGIKGEIHFIHKDRVENEAEEVVNIIKKLKKENSVNYQDVAILVRANNHAEPFTRALKRLGVPYQFLGPGRLYKQPEIIDLISYLKVLRDFDDSVAFYRVLSINQFKLAAQDLIKIGNYARRYNKSLFEACEALDEIYVSSETKKKIRVILEIIKKHLKMSAKESAGQLLYYFLNDTGLLSGLVKPESEQVQKKAENISKFFDKLKSYEVDHDDASVSMVVDWIELAQELGESPLALDIDWTKNDAVNLLTIHSSKGLEFPVVFLVNLVSQRFPSISRAEQIPIPEKLIKEILPHGDHHIQEERRLFYVGMTRAKSKLFFTAADYYGEGKREKRLSPFIFEALGDDSTSSEHVLKKDINSKQLSFLSYSEIEEETKRAPANLHIDYLSYSQIQTFQICPLHYKMRYVLKVPTPPTAALSFGSTIHMAMNDFYQDFRNGKKVTEKTLLNALSANWKKEGYTSRVYEKKMQERGKSYLSGYYKKEFDRKSVPLSLEQPFVVPLWSKETRMLKIGGKIDRVNRGVDGGIEIFDYKTGSPPKGGQKDVDKDLQLTFYALAAASIREAPFGVLPEKIKLTMYFFEGQQRFSTIRTRAQLEDAKKQIFDWRDKIETSDFVCSGHIFCKKCEYRLLCQS